VCSNSPFTSKANTTETGSRDYDTIPKGCGYVYAYENHLYYRVKTEGRTKYLKCTVAGCDGSAKLVGGLRLNSTTRTLSETRTDPTELGDPGRKKVRAVYTP